MQQLRDCHTPRLISIENKLVIFVVDKKAIFDTSCKAFINLLHQILYFVIKIPNKVTNFPHGIDSMAPPRWKRQILHVCVSRVAKWAPHGFFASIVRIKQHPHFARVLCFEKKVVLNSPVGSTCQTYCWSYLSNYLLENQSSKIRMKGLHWRRCRAIGYLSLASYI